MAGALVVVLGIGKRDVTPAAVNWANITANDSGANADQTISDIIQSITLRATMSSVSVSALATAVLRIFVGGVEIDQDTFANAAFIEATVSNGANVHFEADISGLSTDTGSCTVTVTNQTDVGTPTLDTFAVNLTVS